MTARIRRLSSLIEQIPQGIATTVLSPLSRDEQHAGAPGAQAGAGPMRRALAIGAVALALFAVQATADASRFAAQWPQTDFTRSLIDLDEVISGGPPKDGIPALTDPAFMVAAKESRLDPREPVLTYAPEGQTARAYPIRYLMWHEIVNDTVAGTPIAVTFCPLCNSGMIFDRRLAGQTLTFGVSGLLRHSDMVMYDRQSQSWWQQAVGKGIVGRHAGARLAPQLRPEPLCQL